MCLTFVAENVVSKIKKKKDPFNLKSHFVTLSYYDLCQYKNLASRCDYVWLWLYMRLDKIWTHVCVVAWHCHLLIYDLDRILIYRPNYGNIYFILLIILKFDDGDCLSLNLIHLLIATDIYLPFLAPSSHTCSFYCTNKKMYIPLWTWNEFKSYLKL